MGGGRREVGGGKSEDRSRLLEIETIDRCRSNRFGHGMYILFEVQVWLQDLFVLNPLKKPNIP